MFDYPPYEPSRLLFHRHLMTWVGSFPRPVSRRLREAAEERVFRIDDSASVLTTCHWQQEREGHPAMLVVHGLAGDADSPYVLGTADKAHARGFHVVRLNVRNCGDTEHLAKTAYHGGMTDDLDGVARALAEGGVERVFLVGFSLGGNMALKLAAAYGGKAPAWLAGVATVSPCIDFTASSNALEEVWFNRLCRRRFVGGLKRTLRRISRLREVDVPLDRIGSVRTLREFDDVFTAPLNGFRDADDYYEQASSRPHLARICVPALIVTARDDSLIPFASFEDAGLRDNPNVTLVATDKGAHTAFLARSAGRSAAYRDDDRRWAENRVVQFCLELC